MEAKDLKPHFGHRVLGRIGRWPFIGFVREFIVWETSPSGQWVRIAHYEGTRGAWYPVAVVRIIESLRA